MHIDVHRNASESTPIMISVLEFGKSKFSNVEFHDNFDSSSSLHRAASTDFPDLLSPLFSIVHRSQQVLLLTSCIGTELF